MILRLGAVASYQIKDCSLPILGDVFFIILILWGSFFTLNLLLAVLEGNFTKGKEDDKVLYRTNFYGLLHTGVV